MVDLADSIRLLKKSSDEAKILLEQRRLQEEDFCNIFEQHMERRQLIPHMRRLGK